MHKSLIEIPAGAVFTKTLVSSHKTGRSALDKARKLQAQAPVGTGYEVVTNDELYARPFQVFRIVIVRVEAPAGGTAWRVEDFEAGDLIQVIKNGPKIYVTGTAADAVTVDAVSGQPRSYPAWRIVTRQRGGRKGETLDSRP